MSKAWGQDIPQPILPPQRQSNRTPRIAGNLLREVQLYLVDVAPAPTLSWLNRSHNRMLRFMKVLCRMFIRRRIAARRMPALHTHPQMHPPRADLQAILATLRRRLHLMNMVQMSTFHSQYLPSHRFYPLIRCAIPPKGTKSLTPNLGGPSFTVLS
jgi:hypothetical protein